MENKKTGLRNLPINVWIVTATSFLTDISSEMIVNLVPLFLANVLNAGTAIIGLIEGLAETTASLMKIYSGALSDKLGKRKWITVVGYALSAIAKPFMYFAASWEWVLGVRVADRLGKGIRTAGRACGRVDRRETARPGFRSSQGWRYRRSILRPLDRRCDRLADPGGGC
jgi:MFS family permease